MGQLLVLGNRRFHRCRVTRKVIGTVLVLGRVCAPIAVGSMHMRCLNVRGREVWDWEGAKKRYVQTLPPRSGGSSRWVSPIRRKRRALPIKRLLLLLLLNGVVSNRILLLGIFSRSSGDVSSETFIFLYKSRFHSRRPLPPQTAFLS